MTNPTEHNTHSTLLDDHIAQVRANLEQEASHFAPNEDWLPCLTIQKHPNAKAFRVAFDPRYVTNSRTKDQAAAHMARLIAQIKPYIATLSMSAWFKALDRERDPATVDRVLSGELSVSECQNKKEIVSIYSRSSTGETRLLLGNVVRRPNEGPRIEWQFDCPSDGHFGRFPDALEAGFAHASNSTNH